MDAPDDSPAPSGDKPPSPFSYLRNWLSLAGLVIVVGSLFAFILLIAFDLTTGGQNPYVGILSYLVAPAFFFAGNALVFLGWFWGWRRRRAQLPPLRFDLGKLRDRRIFFVFVGGALAFMLVSAVGSYQTYTYTSSNEFCGVLCHSVMEPQFEAYPHSAHAKLSCVDCHVGTGAKGAFKAKWHGLYKVYSLAFDKFPQPLKADPHYLPPVEESCLKCHENDESLSDIAKTFHHYLSDKENTPFSVALRLKLGPDETAAAKTRGIHWHARSDTQIDFKTAAANPDVVAWIQVTHPDGQTTEYHYSPKEDALPEDIPDLSQLSPAQRMDCLDCHSRPAHDFAKPNDLAEKAMRAGHLDLTLPEIKYAVAVAMSAEAADQDEGLAAIAESLQKSLRRADPSQTASAIQTVQALYKGSIFPQMKADWRSFPNHIGHKDTLGCFRCHSDQHATFDGSKTLSASNCNTCHDVISQGEPGSMQFAAAPDTEFEHPDGAYLGFTCADCHTGAVQSE